MPLPPLDTVFAHDGVLAMVIPSYRLRQEQIDMATRIEQTIDDKRILVAEAGTGTGKTLAYLVPALRKGGKTIISTGTKNLQEQLYYKDLPAVREALKIPLRTALLKGRNNYLCLYRMEVAEQQGGFKSPEDARDFRIIKQQSRSTRTGDKSEFHQVSESSGVWYQVTSTLENCLGEQECPMGKECYVFKARNEALAADVVVVNHHLFFADLALRDDGGKPLLPNCNTIILDEAHQIPSVARQFFGTVLSTRQLYEWGQDGKIEGISSAKDATDWSQLERDFKKCVDDARLCLPVVDQRISWKKISDTDKEAFCTAMRTLVDWLSAKEPFLKEQSVRSPGLEKIYARSREIHEHLSRWLSEIVSDPKNDQGSVSSTIHWLELYARGGLQLHRTPLDIATTFSAYLNNCEQAWIMTSATIAVKSDFSHYLRELGLDGQDKTDTCQWLSPFDYASHAMLYVPTAMPAPNEFDFVPQLIERIIPLLKVLPGGAFLLFTSLSSMKRAHSILKPKMAGLEVPRLLLLQGEGGGRTELLEQFRQAGNAILVASHSFWEGVDVKGSALQLVVLDKLPFAPPDDPFTEGQIDYIKKRGGNAFGEFQLPQAAITLKQGAGRLIRDENDEGMLMIGDTRLIDQSYGQRLRQSLPPMKLTRQATEAIQFLSQLSTESSKDREGNKE